MAGHSKWASIKHKKGALDAKRGKKFTKLIREITVAARISGGDPDHNPKLRQLMDKAKSINMPQENTIRAVKKGTGELPGVHYEQCMYEGYGPHNIAILIDALTDNRNKSVAEFRHFFSKRGGNLAESGAVSWMFEKKGVIKLVNQDITEDALFEFLIDHDVSDIFKDESIFIIHCNSTVVDKVKQAIINKSLAVESANLEWVPKNTLALDTAHSEQAIDFLSALEDLDDVQNIYTNLA